MLQEGNSLAVRLSARFPGWVNHASSGILTLTSSDKGILARCSVTSPDYLFILDRKAKPVSNPKKAYLKLVTKQISELKSTFDTYLDAATPVDAPPAYSIVRELLPSGLLRADQSAAAEEPPLRLLSLGMSCDHHHLSS